MASIEELKLERLNKIEGMQAYPAESKYTKTVKEFLDEFEIPDTTPSALQAPSPREGQDTSGSVLPMGKLHEVVKGFGSGGGSAVLVGRIMTKRSFGNLAFAKIFDGTGEVQIVLEREVSEEAINYFDAHIDSGDFVEVSGTNYITKKGENSLLVNNIKLISKALLPLPDKYAGLQDEEEKMRKRYLDLLLDSEKRDLFYKKAKFWQVVRSYLNDKNFLEVETPTLELTTGGAEARPFKTHHNDYDVDVYMRICIGELWQKRLMAAGFPRTYEIGRAYRNEGSSSEHLQEFTNCELYMAYADYKDGMSLAKELYRKIALDVFGRTKFEIKGHAFDLADEWVEIDYADEILKQTGIDIWSATDLEIINKLDDLKVKYDGNNRERLTDTIWKYCRKSISGPAFLINHPLVVSPLAKPNSDGRTAQQFQPILAGSEVGRGYTELNDPRVQRANFEHQEKLIERGDDEAMMPEWDFVEMLEHGMPPACGFALGDRLFAFLAGLPIRETVMFPLVKPKEEIIASKEKVLVSIINKESQMEKWQEMNALSHLAAEMAGKVKSDLFYQDKIETKDNVKLNLNMQHPILIKESNSNLELLDFVTMCKDNNVEAYIFTREMLETNNDKKIITLTKSKNFTDIELLGVSVFGDKEKILELTKVFGLYK